MGLFTPYSFLQQRIVAGEVVAGITATGGYITTALIDGLNYKIHTFTSSADFVVDDGSGDVDWLIIAGGGGGGGNHQGSDSRGGSGGGGAGGLLTGSFIVSSSTWPVVVGAGGAGRPAGLSTASGSAGGVSRFNLITTDGGGGGASTDGIAPPNPIGGPGGSGGGAGGDLNSSYSGGAATAGQGKNGGNGGQSPFRPAGAGGGGAGVAGGNGSGEDAGNGGNGLQLNYTGTLTYYAGGGGGATWQQLSGDTPGIGGLGGGGNGCSGSAGTATNGTDNLGAGGGGGGRYIAGGDGGDGVVIIKYEADYDTASTAFFNATGITDDTTKQAINNLVIQLKLNGIWDECDAIYPFVGGTADTNKYNLKDTSTYTITFGGTWTHDSNGITGNGTNTYADTGWNPTSVGRNTDGHMAVYSRTNLNAGGLMSDMGAGSFPNESLMALANGGTTFWIWSGQVQSAAYGNSQGFYVTARDASNTIGYKNGSSVSSGGNTNNHPNANMYIGAQNTTPAGTRWTSRNYAFASLGSDITDNTTYYNIVQAFQTALGRQV